ncbi:MAG: hypothetical protein GX568_05385 [Candidatus Gastranaerophilales bacterium]|nr:hypothetical protein [Candidatus Gastranaerophilales bacterium]
MPYNFIPEIAHAKLLEDREKAAIAVKHCNREYEGDIKSKGDRVKILTPGEVSLFPYTRNDDMDDPEIIDDAAQYLDITESQAFQYYLDDIDKRQMDKASAFEKSTMRNAAYKISDYADSFVYNLYSEMTNDATFSALNSAKVSDFLAAADKAMRLANVPESEIKYLEISPDVYAKFVKADIAMDTDNSKTLETGLVKKLWGMNIYVSNNIVTTGTTEGSTSYCIVRTKRAIAYAEQINQSESIRHPKRFGDIHRGLFLCGAKLVVPKEAVCFTVKTAAEA